MFVDELDVGLSTRNDTHHQGVLVDHALSVARPTHQWAFHRSEHRHTAHEWRRQQWQRVGHAGTVGVETMTASLPTCRKVQPKESGSAGCCDRMVDLGRLPGSRILMRFKDKLVTISAEHMLKYVEVRVVGGVTCRSQ